MTTQFANFKRAVDVVLSKAATGNEVRQFLGAEANANAADLIGASTKLNWRRFVNGVEDASALTVTIDREGSGSISFIFSRMAEVMPFALAYAIRLSPRGTGPLKKGQAAHYAQSWFFAVNGEVWTGRDYREVPPGAEVILTNSADYHRKIDVGGMHVLSGQPQIVEATRQAVLRKFPGVDAERMFIHIPGGYILRRAGRDSGLSWSRKTKQFTQARTPGLSRKGMRGRGDEMTYPSLVMRELV